MYLKWLGHACFLLELEKIKILMDPYNESLGYPPLNLTADCVTVSHKHFDHNHIQAVSNSPIVISSTQETQIGLVNIKGISVYHDDQKGLKRGENIIFIFEGENLRIAHLGDLGHILSDKEINNLKEIDILLIPVGGVYTVDADSAFKIVESLMPKIVIPMHYKTSYLKFDLGTVEEFTKKFPKDKVTNLKTSEFSKTSEDIKKISGEVWVLSL